MNKKTRKSSTTGNDVSYQDLNVNGLNLPEEISDVSRKRRMSKSPKRSKENDMNKYSRTKLDKPIQTQALKQSKGMNKSSNKDSNTSKQVRNKASIYIYHVEYIQDQILQIATHVFLNV